MINELKL